jgi:hypothetical protein
MTRIRLIMLSLLAVFAVSAVASASASAVVYECGRTSGTEAEIEQGGDVALCKGTPYVEVGSPTEHAPVPFTSTKTVGTSSKLEVEGGPTIVCTAATNTGEFDNSGPFGESENIHNSRTPDASDVFITFTVCQITNTAATKEKCTVHSPGSPDGTIVVSGGKNGNTTDDGLDGILTGAATANPVPIQVEASKSGEPFVIIEIGSKSGTCPLPTGKFNITGKQKGTTGTSTADACAARTVHTLTFLPSGSELKFGTSNAKFELTEDVELTSKEVWGLCPS